MQLLPLPRLVLLLLLLLLVIEKGEREEHYDYDDVYDDGMMTMVVRMATRIMTLDSDDDDVDVAVDKLRSILMMWMLMMAMLMKAKLMVTSMTNMLRRYGGWLGTIARLLLTMTTKMPDDDECSRDMIIRMDRIVMIVIMIMTHDLGVEVGDDAGETMSLSMR